jgi:hypothetical protein
MDDADPIEDVINRPLAWIEIYGHARPHSPGVETPVYQLKPVKTGS